ncbi:hypothetical protein [Streptomyces sp. ISL-100]|uniref:hypothetical protein n=1 Tax=Streptomyces sp. ISL-100 TaxID=2819173 RepID=UPI001BE9BD07|nr:hypothetical protein [Streptomyces sp. ISL-100]MBT2400369.1 hypothetical protein [Streptomyces sp. ISL-100]
MLDELLLATAAAGGTAVVQAAGTDVWLTLQRHVAGWFGRGNPERETGAIRRLQDTADQIADAEPQAVESVRARHEGFWQGQFEGHLMDLPPDAREEAVAGLDHLVELLRRTEAAESQQVTVKVNGGSGTNNTAIGVGINNGHVGNVYSQPASSRTEKAAELVGHVRDFTALLGPDHRNVLIGRANHANAVGESGNPSEAARLYGDVVDHWSRLSSPADPEVLMIRYQHAKWVGEAGRAGESVRLYDDLIPQLAEAHGTNGRYVLQARRWQAILVAEAGDAERAVRLYNELIAHQTDLFGEDDVDTLEARCYLAQCVGAAGDAARAAQMHDALCSDLRRVLGPEHASLVVAERWYHFWHTYQEGTPLGWRVFHPLSFYSPSWRE